MTKRKTLGLQPSEYHILSKAKQAHEANTGEQLDWGAFLLFLLGIYILEQAIKPKKQQKK